MLGGEQVLSYQAKLRSAASNPSEGEGDPVVCLPLRRRSAVWRQLLPMGEERWGGAFKRKQIPVEAEQGGEERERGGMGLCSFFHSSPWGYTYLLVHCWTAHSYYGGRKTTKRRSHACLARR
jgi:hypothetical protein